MIRLGLSPGGGLIFFVVVFLTACGGETISPPSTSIIIFSNEVDCSADESTKCSLSIVEGRTSVSENIVSNAGDEDFIRLNAAKPGILTIWTEGDERAATNASTRLRFHGTNGGGSESSIILLYSGVDPKEGQAAPKGGGVRWQGDNNGILAISLQREIAYIYIVVGVIRAGSYKLVVNFLPEDSFNEDSDGDGFIDAADNCPSQINYAQRNDDGGSFGVLCDTDNDDVHNEEDIDDDGDGLIEIATAAELNRVRYQLDGSGRRLSASAAKDTTGCGGVASIDSCSGYELINPISLANSNYSSGEGWLPLGADEKTPDSCNNGDFFKAEFEGNGWEVRDLTINRPNQNCIGLFSKVSGKIRNLGLRANSIIGNHSVGVLAGFGGNAIIDSSYVVIDSVTGSNDVGGLLGNARNTTILSSYSISRLIRGNQAIGGLVGNGWSAEIRASYANISIGVVGNGSLGGLVGFGKKAAITSSYAVADSVTGGHNIGGLVGDGENASIVSSYASIANMSGDYVGGLMGDGENTSIASSYAVVGSVSGKNSTGGLVGKGDPIAILYSYWDSSTSGILTGDYGSPQTSIALQSSTNYAGIYENWAMQGCGWDFGSSSDYPAILCLPASPKEQRFLYGDLSDDFLRTMDCSDTECFVSIGSSVEKRTIASENLIRGNSNKDFTRLNISAPGIMTIWTEGDEETRTNAATRLSYYGGGKMESSARVHYFGVDPNNGEDLPPEIGVRSGVRWIGDNNGILGVSFANTSMDYYIVVELITKGDYKLVINFLPEDSFNEDSDGDGFIDAADNCPFQINYAQRNDDGGSFGVLCDTDNDDVRNEEDIDDDGDGLIEIATAAELNGVRYQLDGSGRRLSASAAKDTTGCGGVASIDSCSGYELINPISLANSNYSSGEGWLPLGADEKTPDSCNNGDFFKAEFEGNGWEVRDLIINRPNRSCIGLFSGLFSSKSAQIRNLGVRADYVIGGEKVGVLVGQQGSKSVIRSSYAIANAVSGDKQVGGLIGHSNNQAKIRMSNAVIGSVNGSNEVGGLVGRSGSKTIITSSYVTADSVTGRDNYIGGLVGYGEGTTIKEANANVTSSVSGTDSIGGLVGAGPSVKVTSSYVTAHSITGNNRIGGLIGNGEHAIIRSTNVDISSGVDGTRWIGGLLGYGLYATITSSAVVARSVYGNEYDIGGLVGKGDYAKIISSHANISDSVIGQIAVGGLVGYGLNVSIHFSYTNISGAVIGKMESYEIGGLVGFGDNATIRFSYAVVGSIEGDNEVGGLVGKGDNAEITSSYVLADSITGAGRIGGILGAGDNAEITFSHANISGSVDGNIGWIGGLVGDGNNLIVMSSYVIAGSIEGSKASTGQVGGLIGRGDNANITFSYAIAELIRGSDWIGGLVGFGNNMRTTSSYAVVYSMEGGSRVGGLIGFGDYARILSSYTVVHSIGGRDHVGGLIGLGNYAGISYSYANISDFVNGNGSIGGLIGQGDNARISSSYAVAASVTGNILNIGGLAGRSNYANITSSYAAVHSIKGGGNVGGLLGGGDYTHITSSYAVSGSVIGSIAYFGGLVGKGNDINITSSYAVPGSVKGPYPGGLLGGYDFLPAHTNDNSYWDSSTSGVTINEYGSPKTSAELRLPISYLGIYATWQGQGCDWNFGNDMQYPALTCLPIYPAEQRAFYRVTGGDVIVTAPAFPNIQPILSNQR